MISSVLTIDYDEINGVVRVKNKSNFTLEISLVPKPPKRKAISVFVLLPNTFHILENMQDFDINHFYFRYWDA